MGIRLEEESLLLNPKQAENKQFFDMWLMTAGKESCCGGMPSRPKNHKKSYRIFNTQVEQGMSPGRD
jgi:hypothetical protein